MSHWNNNQSLDHHYCLEDFSTILLALNTGPGVLTYGRYLHILGGNALLEIIILHCSLEGRFVSQ